MPSIVLRTRARTQAMPLVKNSLGHLFDDGLFLLIGASLKHINLS